MKRRIGNMCLALPLLVSLLACSGSAAEPRAAFSPDSRTLAVLDGKRTIRVWDVSAGKENKKATLALDPDEVPAQVRYNSDGELEVLLPRYKGFNQGPGRATQETILVCLLNLTSGERSPLIDTGLLLPVAISPKGDRLAHDAALWDVATGKKVRNLPLPWWDGIACKIEFSPDGKTLLYRISESLAQDYSFLFLADTATGKKILQIGEINWEKLRDASFFCYPTFSPDGNRLAFSERDRPALHLWDLGEGKALHRIPLKEFAQVIGFSPDGRTLVSWSEHDRFIRLWEVLTGKERHSYKVARGIRAVLLSPDGKTLALFKEKAVEFRPLIRGMK